MAVSRIILSAAALALSIGTDSISAVSVRDSSYYYPPPAIVDTPVATTTPVEQVPQPQTCLGIQRKLFKSGKRYLVVEALNDFMVHYEVSEQRQPPSGQIWMTPMIDLDRFEENYCGPMVWNAKGPNVMETAAVRVTVDPNSLSVTTFDLIKNIQHTTFSYSNLSSGVPNSQKNPSYYNFHWTKEGTQHIYGLMSAPGVDSNRTDGNFMGTAFSADHPWSMPTTEGFGNTMTEISAGAMGFAQFPIVYNVGSNGYQHAFFLDSQFKNNWDLTTDNFTITSVGPRALRWFSIAGPSVLEIRKSYMTLVGRMQVPAKAWLGFHQAFFGFRNWSHVHDEVDHLNKAGIPVDSMFMDLFWFGAKVLGHEFPEEVLKTARFGSLAWDPIHFPNVAENAKAIRQKGPGLTLIEEPYISQSSPTFAMLKSARSLVRASVNGISTGSPTILSDNPWWGVGGYVDWTAPNASLLWADCKRCKLIADCKPTTECPDHILEPTEAADSIIGHWTDLGEPEMFDEDGQFFGIMEDDGFIHTTHRSITNIYQLLSTKGLYDMYERNNLKRRVSNYARTGAPGIQRYGAMIWSGDISADTYSMALHFGQRKHMVMNGIDLHSSDVGGFHRRGCDPAKGCDIDALYTLWLANSIWFDLPIKPHCNDQQAPSANAGVMGHIASNAFNVQLRYYLIPLLYSLAVNAHLTGEPIIYPMFLKYPDDLKVRNMGSQYAIGPIIAPVHDDVDSTTERIYLPAGSTWYHIHTHECIQGTGDYSAPMSIYPFGRTLGALTLPAVVQSGSIFPVSYTDSKTLNSHNERTDKITLNAMQLRVYPGPYSTFTVYDDDGETRESIITPSRRLTTVVSQIMQENTITIVIEASTGEFTGVSEEKSVAVDIILPIGFNTVDTVLMDGDVLPTLYHGTTILNKANGWLLGGFGKRVLSVFGPASSIRKSRTVVVTVN